MELEDQELVQELNHRVEAGGCGPNKSLVQETTSGSEDAEQDSSAASLSESELPGSAESIHLTFQATSGSEDTEEDEVPPTYPDSEEGEVTPHRRAQNSQRPGTPHVTNGENALLVRGANLQPPTQSQTTLTVDHAFQEFLRDWEQIAGAWRRDQGMQTDQEKTKVHVTRPGGAATFSCDPLGDETLAYAFAAAGEAIQDLRRQKEMTTQAYTPWTRGGARPRAHFGRPARTPSPLGAYGFDVNKPGAGAGLGAPPAAPRPPDQEPYVPPVMDNRALMKSKKPPTFYGRDGEDSIAWMERYERTGRYNRWTDQELRFFFEAYLDGAAQKWYTCCESEGTLPAAWSVPRRDGDSDWESDSEDEGEEGAPRYGMKELFLRQFTPSDYTEYCENRLCGRRQGPYESVSEYYYDVLDLCRLVDRNMSEKRKVEHLIRGLCPELKEKLWLLRPKKCVDLLRSAQDYLEMTERRPARREEVAVALASCEEKKKEIEKEFLNKTRKGKEERTPQNERSTEALIEKLENSFEKMLQKVMELVPRQPMRGPLPQRRSADRVDRTHDGRPICFNCNRPGHIGRHCPSVRNRNPSGLTPDLRPRESWQAPPSLNPHAPQRGPPGAPFWDARGHDSPSRNNYQRNEEGWRNGPPP